jgi:hypothetical protein
MARCDDLGRVAGCGKVGTARRKKMAGKTPTELLAALDAEATKFSLCAIVLRFEKGAAFVPAGDPYRLATLTGYQNAAGRVAHPST